MLRLFVDGDLAAGQVVALPAAAARHVQVRRLQPGDALCLFNGRGGEWSARVLAMGRQTVQVEPLAHVGVERELDVEVTLAVGMPANERMDWLVEKATELGAAAIAPLLCARSVLRLQGERAERRCAHWQALAAAAAEQCGRTRVPRLHPVQPLAALLAGLPAASAQAPRWLLAAPLQASEQASQQASQQASGHPALKGAVPAQRPEPEPLSGLLPDLPPGRRLLVLSGPEGGLGEDEDAAARAAGFRPTTLGPRVLRAETAPLALLAALGLR